MGFIRVLLALCVVVGHSQGIGGIYLLGAKQAVVCFYVISGYYMALVINNKYRDNIKIFYLSRLFRLWPAYLSILLFFTIPIYLIIGKFDFFLNQFAPLTLSHKILVIVSNIFLIGQDLFWLLGTDSQGNIFYSIFGKDPASNGYQLLLNMPSFTISIEIFFYLIAPLFVKNIKNCIYLLLFGSFYHIGLKSVGIDSIVYQYHLFPASLFYFALGALIFLISQENYRFDGNKRYFVGTVLFILILSTPLLMPSYFILAFAISIPLIFSKTKSLKLDRSLGDLSYVIYLVHWPIFELMKKFFEIKKIGFYSLPLTLFISIIFYFLIEIPFERFRSGKIEKILGNNRNNVLPKT